MRIRSFSAGRAPAISGLPLLIAFPLMLAPVSHLRATPVDSANFTETTFVTVPSQVTGMAWAPDGSNRLFVTRKGGSVRVVKDGVLVAAPFATITPVYTGSECGVVGMCFDPDYINNRYVYFFVTVSSSEQQIIRYFDSAGTGTGKTTIIGGLPTVGANHDGGGIGFGPDGKIYWSIGDLGGGTGVNADLTSLASKVGRANRNGSPCDDNPFADGAGPNNEYIWARGFRNPFTLTFQPGTGKLWLNVTGGAYEQVFVVQRGDHGGWNTFENNQPSGYIDPSISWLTNGSITANIAAAGGAARSGNIVTITKTSSSRQFQPGAKVTIAGVANPGFNGTFHVLSRPNDTQFTVAQNGPDEVSGSGTITAENIGGAITGGCFYDSTGFPAGYHGNFFAGDYNTGNIIRAIPGADRTVSNVDVFVTGNSSHVDMATGPDGALYLARHGGTIQRLAYTGSSAQNLIVQPTHFNVLEGGSGIFTVRLAQEPANDVTVTVARSAGDPDLSVATGTSLTFTPANWNQLQAVTIAGAEDADFISENAVFRVSSDGLTGYDVGVHHIENDESNLVLSQESLSVPEGGTGTFTVALAAPPAGTLTVSVARDSGDPDITVNEGSTLNFTPANYAAPQTVTVAAAGDADIDPDTATLSLTAPGQQERTVVVNVTDSTGSPPLITTLPVTTAVVNAAYTYDVNASGAPAPVYSLTQKPEGMTIDAASGVIQWNPSATGTYAVTVKAANTMPPDATQSYELTVVADAAPVAVITAPAEGAVISGTSAEFFGDGTDDVRCVKAEFYVDGALEFTDSNESGHYHYGGVHAAFDTTEFPNGPHTLRMTVTDSSGQTGTREVAVLIGNGVEAWRSGNFTEKELNDPAVSSLTADPDTDGLSNLMEYAHGLDPKVPGLDRLPVAAWRSLDGTEVLTLEIVRVKWATDITYHVQTAELPDGPWVSADPLNPANQFSPPQENVPAPGLQTILVRVATPKAGSRHFVRLMVRRP